MCIRDRLESNEEIDMQVVAQGTDDWMECTLDALLKSCTNDTNQPHCTPKRLLFRGGILGIGWNAIFER